MRSQSAVGTLSATNYSFSFVNGTLTVSAAPLTITPTSESKSYGATYSLTAFSTSGLQNSDSVTGVTLTSSGTAATATVGSYAITASAATGHRPEQLHHRLRHRKHPDGQRGASDHYANQ